MPRVAAIFRIEKMRLIILAVCVIGLASAFPRKQKGDDGAGAGGDGKKPDPFKELVGLCTDMALKALENGDKRDWDVIFGLLAPECERILGILEQLEGDQDGGADKRKMKKPSRPEETHGPTGSPPSGSPPTGSPPTGTPHHDKRGPGPHRGHGHRMDQSTGSPAYESSSSGSTSYGSSSSGSPPTGSPPTGTPHHDKRGPGPHRGHGHRMDQSTGSPAYESSSSGSTSYGSSSSGSPSTGTPPMGGRYHYKRGPGPHRGHGHRMDQSTGSPAYESSSFGSTSYGSSSSGSPSTGTPSMGGRYHYKRGPGPHRGHGHRMDESTDSPSSGSPSTESSSSPSSGSPSTGDPMGHHKRGSAAPGSTHPPLPHDAERLLKICKGFAEMAEKEENERSVDEAGLQAFVVGVTAVCQLAFTEAMNAHL